METKAGEKCEVGQEEAGTHRAIRRTEVAWHKTIVTRRSSYYEPLVWSRDVARGTNRALKLFLTQKIEVGVTAGTRIDDGGEVPR